MTWPWVHQASLWPACRSSLEPPTSAFLTRQEPLLAAEKVAIDADPLEPDVEVLLVGEADTAVDLRCGSRDEDPHLGGVGLGVSDDQPRLIAT